MFITSVYTVQYDECDWLVCETISGSFPEATEDGAARRPPDEATEGNRQDVLTEELFKVTAGTASHAATNHVLGHLHAASIHKHTFYIH